VGIIVSFVLLTVRDFGKTTQGDAHGTDIVIPIIFFLASLIIGAVAGLSTFAAFVDMEEGKNYK
jgi:hypothetical protein